MPREKLYNFAWSCDGYKFAVVRGREVDDVVLFVESNCRVSTADLTYS